MTTTTYPKSYMTDAERDELRRSGLSQNSIYSAESQAADDADDEETAEAWLRLAVLPAHVLLTLKHSFGADYVRDLGYKLAPAEAAYGADWLDNPSV
jgi:hypothetical protein